MSKKRYIKPEIREETQVLTVFAWVTATTTSFFVQRAEARTSIAAQRVTDVVSRTSVYIQEAVVNSSVFLQRRFANFLRRLR